MIIVNLIVEIRALVIVICLGMNLMIIELLLMKLHVHDMYKCVYCELCSN